VEYAHAPVWLAFMGRKGRIKDESKSRYKAQHTKPSAWGDPAPEERQSFQSRSIMSAGCFCKIKSESSAWIVAGAKRLAALTTRV
jgi:hypothetical protein